MIRQVADAQGDSPPPIFDPLGEGVDVRDLETSMQAGGATGGGGSKSVGGKVSSPLFPPLLSFTLFNQRNCH